MQDQSSPSADRASAAPSHRKGLMLLMLLGCVMISTMSSAGTQGDPLARFRWKARVLVVLAADPQSPALAEQKRQFDSLNNGAQELAATIDAMPMRQDEMRRARSRPE